MLEQVARALDDLVPAHGLAGRGLQLRHLHRDGFVSTSLASPQQTSAADVALFFERARDGTLLYTSPPPVYNFATIPVVSSRRPHWDQKYFGGPAPEPAGAAPEAIHLPGGSVYPLVISVGLLVASFSMIYLVWIGVGLGVLVTVAGIAGWARERR